MPKEVIEFLKSQWIGVLAVEMLDGAPHAATVHYAFSVDPFILYFETYNTYRKAEPILKNETTRATFVVGFDENNRRTFQADGIIRKVLSDEERIIYNKVYFERFPKKKEKAKGDPRFIFFSFTPTWWRYTNFEAPGGKLILNSENK